MGGSLTEYSSPAIGEELVGKCGIMEAERLGSDMERDEMMIRRLQETLLTKICGGDTCGPFYLESFA